MLNPLMTIDELRDFYSAVWTRLKSSCNVKNPDVDTRIVKWKLVSIVLSCEHYMHVLPVSHIYGWHLTDIEHRDRAAVVRFERGIDDAISRMRQGILINRTLPIQIVRRVIAQCRVRIRESVANCVTRPLRKLLTFLVGTYRKACRRTVGWYVFDESDSEYKQQIVNEVTLRLEPIELHRAALVSLGANARELTRSANVLRNNNFAGTMPQVVVSRRLSRTVVSRMRTCLRFKSKYRLNGTCRRSQTSWCDHVQTSGSSVITVTKELSDRCGTTHTYTSCRVRYVNRRRERLNGMAYYQVANGDKVGKDEDRSDPCVVLNGSLTWPKQLMNYVMAHEFFPGHHHETSTHRYKHRRKVTELGYLSDFSGYIEGWATYSERLWGDAYENSGDKLWKNALALLRIARIVVDTAMHSSKCGKWNYHECVAFMVNGTVPVCHSDVADTECLRFFTGVPFPREVLEHEVLCIASRPAYAMTHQIGYICFQYYRVKGMTSGFNLEQMNKSMLSRRVPFTLMNSSISECFGDRWKSRRAVAIDHHHKPDLTNLHPQDGTQKDDLASLVHNSLVRTESTAPYNDVTLSEMVRLESTRRLLDSGNLFMVSSCGL